MLHQPRALRLQIAVRRQLTLQGLDQERQLLLQSNNILMHGGRPLDQRRFRHSNLLTSSRYLCDCLLVTLDVCLLHRLQFRYRSFHVLDEHLDHRNDSCALLAEVVFVSRRDQHRGKTGTLQKSDDYRSKGPRFGVQRL